MSYTAISPPELRSAKRPGDIDHFCKACGECQFVAPNVRKEHRLEIEVVDAGNRQRHGLSSFSNIPSGQPMDHTVPRGFTLYKKWRYEDGDGDMMR